MGKIIRKTTSKVTKEAIAKKLYESLTLDQKNDLYILVGKIACGEVKNFYSTKLFMNLTKDLNKNQRSVVSYICRKHSAVKVFDNVEDLVLAEE